MRTVFITFRCFVLSPATEGNSGEGYTERSPADRSLAERRWGASLRARRARGNSDPTVSSNGVGAPYLERSARLARRRYFANSMQRVSRTTVTRIWPGYWRLASTLREMLRA